jgi:hypothetical protein
MMTKAIFSKIAGLTAMALKIQVICWLPRPICPHNASMLYNSSADMFGIS